MARRHKVNEIHLEIIDFIPFSSYTPEDDGIEVFNNNDGDPVAFTIDGEWETTSKTEDGSTWILELNL